MTVSLAGCGFLGVYLIGALECLKRFLPRFMQRAQVFGVSAGAIVGASLVSNVPLDGVKYVFLGIAAKAQNWAVGPFSPGFKFGKYLHKGLEGLPPDAHIQASGRLHVSVTRVSNMTNVIISEWETREDLIQTLRCSCFILGYSGMQPPLVNGERYIDGGYSKINRKMAVGSRCISISPFSGDADICPQEDEAVGKLQLSNQKVDLSFSNAVRLYRTLMPPPPHELSEYYHSGYLDAYKYLKKRRRALLQTLGACVSLSGSGFLGMYELGAVACLHRYWPQLLVRANVAGASAGAILAACVVCGVPLETIRSIFIQTAVEAHKWAMGPFNPNFKIEDHIKTGLETLPWDAHIRANDRLFISLTKLTCPIRNELVSRWDSRDELIACILCSCFIPLFSGWQLPTFRGEKCMDGGFTNNLPTTPQPAVTISPFHGLVDICPNDNLKNPVYVTMANEQVSLTVKNLIRFIRALIPPPVEDLEQLYYLGYRDAYSFLKSKSSGKQKLIKP